MKLHEHMQEDAICVNLNSRERDAAIAELAGLLKNNPAVKDFQGFLEAVFARESESTTGIGDMVAIPHARTDTVSDLVVAVGISRAGIDFKAVDGKPVHLVILMGIPAHKVNLYLRLLAHLSFLFKQNGFIQRLLSASDREMVLKMFAEYEE